MGDEVGGLAVNIGPQQSMALRVTSYRPLVRCSDDPGPLPQACQELIQRMPSTGSSPSAPKIIFGEAGDPDVQVGLPYTITEPSGQCEATITTVRGLSDLAKWYEMWEGVVAVAGMCVRAGYAGLGFHRGTRGYLTVTLTKGRAARGGVSEE
ncbi:hypothetical protein XPA_009650 [Xanthoria parietina]